ncbi:hypothetical protein Ciccas_010793, partial [Cichlidogyrus casuarinus]
MSRKIAQIPLMQQDFEYKITNLQCQIQEREIMSNSLKNQNNSLTKELASLKQNNWSKDDKNELFSEICSLKKQLEVQYKNVHRLEAEIVERDFIVASKTNRLAILEKSHAQLSGEISNYRSIETSFKNQVLSLNRDLSEMRDRLRERNSKLKEAEEEIEKSHDIISNYQETMALKKELESGDEVYGPLSDLQQQIRGFVSTLNKSLVDNSICSFVEHSLETSREFPVAKTIPEDLAVDLKVAVSLLTNVAGDLNGKVHPQKELSLPLDKENYDAEDSINDLMLSIPKTPRPVRRRNLYKKKPLHHNLDTTISIPSHLKSLKNQLNQLVEEEQHSVCDETSTIGDVTMNIKQKSDLSRQMMKTVKDLERLFENMQSETQERTGQCAVAFVTEPTKFIYEDLTSPTLSDMDEQASVVNEESVGLLPISQSTAEKKPAAESTFCANSSVQFDGRLFAKERLEQELKELTTVLEQEKCNSASLRNTSLQQQKYISEIEEKLLKAEQDRKDRQADCEKQKNSSKHLEHLLSVKEKEVKDIMEKFEIHEEQLKTNEGELEKAHRLCEDYELQSRMKEGEAEKLRVAHEEQIIRLEAERQKLLNQL